MGLQEGLIIAIVLMAMVGAGRLPQVGQSLLKSVYLFRRALNGTDEVDITPQETPEVAQEPDKPSG